MHHERIGMGYRHDLWMMRVAGGIDGGFGQAARSTSAIAAIVPLLGQRCVSFKDGGEN